MKVADLLRKCRNGTKIEIEQYVYSADGDNSSTVFEGTVGVFGKTGFEREDVAYIGTRSNSILIIISEVKERSDKRKNGKEND